MHKIQKQIATKTEIYIKTKNPKIQKQNKKYKTQQTTIQKNTKTQKTKQSNIFEKWKQNLKNTTNPKTSTHIENAHHRNKLKIQT